MVVNGKIDEALITTFQDAIAHEAGAQHPIAALAGNIVHTINSEMERPCQQSDSPVAGPRYARRDDRTVLVAVTGK